MTPNFFFNKEEMKPVRCTSVAKRYLDIVGCAAGPCVVIGEFRSDYFLSYFMGGSDYVRVDFPSKGRAMLAVLKPKNLPRILRLVKHGLFVAAATSYLAEMVERKNVKVAFAFYSSKSICLSLLAIELTNLRLISVYPAQVRQKFTPFIPSPINFCCFGREDKEQLLKMGQPMGKVHITGSVYRNMYAISRARPVEKTATICVISSITERVGTSKQNSTLGNEIFIRDSVERLLSSSQGKTVSIVVAGRPQVNEAGRRAERDFYSGLLSHPQVRYEANKGKGFDSYILAESSEVVMAQRSTLAFECLRLETRVLFVNIDDHRSPVSTDYPFLISDAFFGTFSKTLNRLRGLSQDEYESAISQFRDYSIGSLQRCS